MDNLDISLKRRGEEDGHLASQTLSLVYGAATGQIYCIVYRALFILLLYLFGCYSDLQRLNSSIDLMDHQTSTEVAVQSLAGLDEYTTHICLWIIYTVICQSVEVFGIVTNVINIICFAKQGLGDPINISLLGLAVSDLGCLTTLIWINITFTPAFSEADLPFEAIDVFYLVAAMPHATFSRITSWITAMITLERCLCIIAPLKVKLIVTPKRVATLIASIFIIIVVAGSPIYLVHKLDLKFFPGKNKTVVGLISSPDRENVEKIYFALNNFVLPTVAFVMIIACTAILVLSLNRRTKWRRKSSANGKSNVSNRNQRVAKMVVTISTLFIACFIPISVVFLALVFEPELSVGGRLVNIGVVAGGFGVLLEAINSSINIFIYYYMSSKYRDTFRDLFCMYDGPEQ